MATITFDTLKFANRLKAAGILPAQAEAEAEVLAEALEVNLKELVTKEDLRRELRELEYRMVIKLGGLIVLAVGVVATLVKLL